MNLTCSNCGGNFNPGDRVIPLRVVTGIVAPDDPDAYVTHDATRPPEGVHARCPEEANRG